jgi:hypothetical protein
LRKDAQRRGCNDTHPRDLFCCAVATRSACFAAMLQKDRPGFALMGYGDLLDNLRLG